MNQQNKIIVYISILLLLNVAKSINANSDSVLILIEKSSYHLPPKFPDSLDIMYNSPLIWITEGIRIALDSRGNDLNGYALLADCYFDGHVKCLKTAGPNTAHCNKMSTYLDTTQFRPWIESLVASYGQEPVRLLISWSEDNCFVEQLISKKNVVDSKKKLFTREWKGFHFQQ